MTIEITQRPDGRIQIRAPFELKDLCKALPGRRWDPQTRTWHVPGTPAVAYRLMQALIKACPNGESELEIPDFVMSLVQHIGQADELRACTDELPPVPQTKMEPWSNQLRGYHMIQRQQATFLAWEMGTGKTKAVVDAVANIEGLRRAIVLCPASVIDVWPKEFLKHTDREIHVAPLSRGSVAKRTKQAQGALEYADELDVPCVLVLNFEAAWREAFAKWSLARKWDMVVADESHRVKSPGGKASKYLARLGTRAARRVCLTGTPMPHSPLDVYAQYRFLDSGIFGTSFTAFRATYAIMGGFQNHQVVRYQRLDDLHEKFYSIADRVRKVDVLDLPAFVHEERIIGLSPKTRRVYDELEGTMMADVGAGVVTASNALARLTRLQQVTSGFAMVETDRIDQRGGIVHDLVVLDEDKRKTLVDLLKHDVEPGQPVIVFCRFHHDLDAIHEAAEAAGRKSLELSGRRKDIGSTWEDGEDTVLAVQIKAGGIGVDLTRANVAVYYSLGFDGGDYEQSLARCHRQGQESKVTYIHFVVEGTIDRKIYTALAARAAVVRDVLAQETVGGSVAADVLKQLVDEKGH
jgi:SNF2 family DNA or RNA helicase